MSRPAHLFSLSFVAFAVSNPVCLPSLADGPIDNQDAQVRRIPPAGIELPVEVRADLLRSVNEIEEQIPKFDADSATRQASKVFDAWNDVRVITRAVRLTIEGEQFNKEPEIDQARKLLQSARNRVLELTSPAAQIAGFVPSWLKESGRMIAGYRSRLDDSIQPFGIIVPENVVADPKKLRRLDIWLHGRDENVSEVSFLYRRSTQDSPYLPDDTFVLQPWGRYSNAFRFAGEVDVFEALAEVQRRYAIDPDRISIRGFSMGGAGCWNLAVHHPDRFFAANPGAGFCETERFLTGFQSETLTPTPAQRRLWNLYDCPPVVRNLINLPTIAYSGGIDRQKEAADIMTEAATKAGFHIPYVIHQESAHAIHPDAKIEIEKSMSQLAIAGRVAFPKSVSWSTFTLQQPGAYWVNMSALNEHWTKAAIEASFSDDLRTLDIKTDNVRSFEVNVAAGAFDKTFLADMKTIQLIIDGQNTGELAPSQDGSLKTAFDRNDATWSLSTTLAADPLTVQTKTLYKRSGLQGPIDDAFLDRFLIVRPTGSSDNVAIDAWVERELEHAIDHWRLQFRGDARVKLDVEVTQADLDDSNVICFGTPNSNRLIAKLIDKLPLRWSKAEVGFGKQQFDASKVVPLLIYPNPLAPHRYVVFNSGFTYREYDYLNNARQTPKLPDWAMIDATTPTTTRAAGQVISEGFFDEKWLP
ncbi:MAG: prolyl oligopeptidase family serine peptidase [Pirellulaceae bacterium]|nr:prolyl oligopeptidase family serine peptidase [Pirellulaceae bacterium]